MKQQIFTENSQVVVVKQVAAEAEFMDPVSMIRSEQRNKHAVIRYILTAAFLALYAAITVLAGCAPENMPQCNQYYAQYAHHSMGCVP